jgi:hypothetical protein
LYQNYAKCLGPEPEIQPVSEPVSEAEAEADTLPEWDIEPVSDIKPERPDVQAIHFRRFSEQQLESAKKRGVQGEAEPDEQDISPCLWGRVVEKFHFEEELQLESVPELDSKPPTALALKRLSLCMMPPDEMQDVLQAMSCDLESVQDDIQDILQAPAASPDRAAPEDTR